MPGPVLYPMSLKIIKIGENLLAENDRIARENRKILQSKGIISFNLMGGPGCGKTSLLEKTIPLLLPEYPCAVIEGDVAGSLDGERLARFPIPVIQINTGGGCHLDAAMVKKALEKLPLESLRIIFVENVGNLVCPAEFPLGTERNIVVSAVTEGEDKPRKYPLMFQIASLCLLNKIDLLPLVKFSRKRFQKFLQEIRKDLKVLPVSAETGAHLEDWVKYIISPFS